MVDKLEQNKLKGDSVPMDLGVDNNVSSSSEGKKNVAIYISYHAFLRPKATETY